MPSTEDIKIERGDIRIRTRAALTAILWWDTRDICTLMNIHAALAEGNFCNEEKSHKAANCDGL